MTTPTPDEIADGLRAQLKTACQAARDEAARADKLASDLAARYVEAAENEGVISTLKAELEDERIRLAACGAVAMANTPESAAKMRQMKDKYRSASLSDVERAVDAEIALRAELASEKAHAEAMEHRLQLHLERTNDIGTKMVLDAYRAAHPKD